MKVRNKEKTKSNVIDLSHKELLPPSNINILSSSSLKSKLYETHQLILSQLI